MKIQSLFIAMLFLGLLASPANVSAQCTINLWNPYGDYSSVGVGTYFPLYWKATGCGNGSAYTLIIYDQYGGTIDTSTGTMNSNTTYSRMGMAIYPLGLHTATITTSGGASHSTYYYVTGYPSPTYPPYPPPTYPPAMLQAEAGPSKTAKIGETVVFDGSGSTSSYPITSYVWDFGDGATGYGKTATHAYSSADSFTVTLTIIDSRGSTAKDTILVMVKNPNVPPVARISGDKTVKKGEKATFDGSGSNDVDGTIVAYKWDFGDGTSGTGIMAIHVYMQQGTYTTTLTVIDNNSLSSSAPLSIIVEEPPLPPHAVLNASQLANVGEVVLFNASGSTGSGLNYRWSFGDGMVGEGATAMHVYNRAGSYIVTLTVTSGEGLSDTAQSAIAIKEKGLLAGGMNVFVIAGFGIILILAIIFLVVYFVKH